jgi:hypothetical protein
VQRLLTEKLQGANRLDQDVLIHLLVEEIELIGANMLGSETIGGGAKMLGALGDRTSFRPTSSAAS